MKEVVAAADAVVDVAFPLRGQSLPRDHGEALADALGRLLPWLETEPTAGIHMVKVVPGDGPDGLLSGRARLLIRLPRARQEELDRLVGLALTIGRCELQLGAPKAFDLVPHGTLYAPMVAAERDDEAAFMQDVAQQLASLGVDCHCICGKRRQVHRQGVPIAGFSLMLHGLKPAQSILLQRVGLGPHRRLGCGIFVPHKSAAAVGS
ncbi:MAG: type I-MYXAN CRISPR-associated protein Cas6/Cmx6 [Rhizobacter sp.]|nr:type I-MYXAN CRISPR-associated protein Cas6/Cmx6 [Rhizobacter sp.]